jgi:hypothetical protein
MASIKAPLSTAIAATIAVTVVLPAGGFLIYEGINGFADIRNLSASHQQVDSFSFTTTGPVRQVAQCDVDTTDQLSHYLTTTPCVGMTMQEYDAAGGVSHVPVYVAWIKMPTAAAAVDLEHLAEQPGTGSIHPFALGMSFSANHVTRVDDVTVIIARAGEPVLHTFSADLEHRAELAAVKLSPP